MRTSITMFAGLFLSAMLAGCGASPTIPEPPANANDGPPPGTSPEMLKAPKNQGNAMAPARPPAKPAGK